MTDDDKHVHHEHHRVTDTSSGQFHIVTLAEDAAGHRTITETGRFQRAVKWAMSWKGLLVAGFSLLASMACWAAKAAVDSRVVVGVIAYDGTQASTRKETKEHLTKHDGLLEDLRVQGAVMDTKLDILLDSRPMRDRQLHPAPAPRTLLPAPETEAK